MKIMFVDDEELLCDLACRVLCGGGHEVCMYTSPLRAYQAFASRPDEFDALVSDYNMPEITGLELVARVRAIRKDLPILMVSANYPEGVREEAGRLGVDSMLEKPLTPSELLSAMESLRF